MISLSTQAKLRRQFQNNLPLFKSILAGFCLLLVIGIIVGGYYVSRVTRVSPLHLWEALTGSDTSLKQHEARINLLLLGIGGKGHAGEDLTDTIMVVSAYPQIAELTLISLPRDIWIPELKDKINSAYHYGEQKQAGSGLVVAKATIEQVAGIPIHYALLLDFSGFTRIVNTVGGIDVQVSETFTDNLYPIAGRENDTCAGDPEYRCRYESVTFTQGKEHMDGERALKYVRSRHAQGEIGTDFSREKRQQAVLIALKNKLLRRETITNIGLLWQLKQELRNTITTDLTGGEMLVLARVLKDSAVHIRSITLTQDEPEKHHPGLLINPPPWQYGGVWVLVPKDGDFKEIGEYIACVLKNTSKCESLLEQVP